MPPSFDPIPTQTEYEELSSSLKKKSSPTRVLSAVFAAELLSSALSKLLSKSRKQMFVMRAWSWILAFGVVSAWGTADVGELKGAFPSCCSRKISWLLRTDSTLSCRRLFSRRRYSATLAWCRASVLALASSTFNAAMPSPCRFCCRRPYSSKSLAYR